MQDLELIQYYIELRAPEEYVEELIWGFMSDSAAALLKNFEAEIEITGQDIDWYGDPWINYQVRFRVPPATKLLIDMLGEFS